MNAGIEIAGGMIVIVIVIGETAREIVTGPLCRVLLFPDLVPLLWHQKICDFVGRQGAG